MTPRFHGHMHPRHAVRVDQPARTPVPRVNRVFDALLAVAIGLVLGFITFYGLSGGFRP